MWEGGTVEIICTQYRLISFLYGWHTQDGYNKWLAILMGSVLGKREGGD